MSDEMESSETTRGIGSASPPMPYLTLRANIPTDLSLEILSELEELEEWAKANQRDANRDTLRFWALKVPALLASSCAGIFGYFNIDWLPILSGSIGSICILIDGLNPGGALRNAHLMAVHDLRSLQNEIKTIARFTAADDPQEIRKEIYRIVRSERKRIGDYLRDAETLLAKER